MADDDPNKRLYFDLSGVPMQKRRSVWKDTLNGFFYDYDSWLPTDFRTGQIEGCYAGGLSVASVESDAMTVLRSQAQISRDGLDAYFVLLPNKSRISLSQHGREAHVGDKEFALVSTSDAYRYVQTETTLFNNLIIPGKMLREVAPRADDAVSRLSGNRTVERLFSDLANSFCLGLHALDARACEVVSRQAVELLGLVLDGADHGSSATPVQLANRRRIMKLIEQNYTDPTFDVGTIALALRCSARSVQAILAASGETPSDAIRCRRIREARRLLSLRKLNRLSVKQVAFKVGFNNVAHFSRVFKAETGFSPTDTPETGGNVPLDRSGG